MIENIESLNLSDLRAELDIIETSATDPETLELLYDIYMLIESLTQLIVN